MTLTIRDTQAIENGMRKYKVDSKGFIGILKIRLSNCKNSQDKERYLHLIKCTEVYIEWGM